MPLTVGPGGVTAGPPVDIATVPRSDGFSSTFEVGADGRLLMTHSSGRDHVSVVFNWPQAPAKVEQSGVGR